MAPSLRRDLIAHPVIVNPFRILRLHLENVTDHADRARLVVVYESIRLQQGSHIVFGKISILLDPTAPAGKRRKLHFRNVLFDLAENSEALIGRDVADGRIENSRRYGARLNRFADEQLIEYSEDKLLSTQTDSPAGPASLKES
jgi:hypothetical protein